MRKIVENVVWAIPCALLVIAVFFLYAVIIPLIIIPAMGIQATGEKVVESIKKTFSRKNKK